MEKQLQVWALQSPFSSCSTAVVRLVVLLSCAFKTGSTITPISTHNFYLGRFSFDLTFAVCLLGITKNDLELDFNE